MRIVKRIQEADYGCEERLPGQPLMVIVTLENEDGTEEELPADDALLRRLGIDEGSTWPEEWSP